MDKHSIVLRWAGIFTFFCTSFAEKNSVV